MADWRIIFSKLINRIKDSGLYEIVKEIRCGILGNKDEEYFKDPKIKIIYESKNMNEQEHPTLLHLTIAARREQPFNVLYLHTKGVSKVGLEKRNVEDWTSFLSYYTINPIVTQIPIRFHKTIIE